MWKDYFLQRLCLKPRSSCTSDYSLLCRFCSSIVQLAVRWRALHTMLWKQAKAGQPQTKAARGLARPWLCAQAAVLFGGLQHISLSPCSLSVLRPRARAASWLTILQCWHKAYCLGARHGGGGDGDAAFVQANGNGGGGGGRCAGRTHGGGLCIAARSRPNQN